MEDIQSFTEAELLPSSGVGRNIASLKCTLGLEKILQFFKQPQWKYVTSDLDLDWGFSSW